MRKDTVKKILIEYLKRNKIDFLQEVSFGSCKIDFLIKSNGNWVGVVVKGDRAKEILTLGQLVNYYKYISHFMLCASKLFVNKIRGLILNNPELSHLNKKLGWVVIDDGKIEFRPPQNSKYYFLVEKNLKKHEKYYSNFPKYDRPDETDVSIVELVKNKRSIMLCEIMKLFGLSYENTRKKIKNLEHFGYLKIASKYPTTVSIGVKYEERTSKPKV